MKSFFKKSQVQKVFDQISDIVGAEETVPTGHQQALLKIRRAELMEPLISSPNNSISPLAASIQALDRVWWGKGPEYNREMRSARTLLQLQEQCKSIPFFKGDRKELETLVDQTHPLYGIVEDAFTKRGIEIVDGRFIVTESTALDERPCR